MNWKSWDLSYFLCFVGERGAKKLNFLITFCVGVQFVFTGASLRFVKVEEAVYWG